VRPEQAPVPATMPIYGTISFYFMLLFLLAVTASK
jgi:hypothetical protein